MSIMSFKIKATNCLCLKHLIFIFIRKLVLVIKVIKYVLKKAINIYTICMLDIFVKSFV